MTHTHRVTDLAADELELPIEQKILEILGYPDSGLELRDEFKNKLRERLSSASLPQGGSSKTWLLLDKSHAPELTQSQR